MHEIDYQYLKIITTPSKDIDMHDLYSIYRKVYKQVKQHLKEYLVMDNNVKFYSHKPNYGTIPTFQHDDNNDWKTLILNTTKTG